MKFKIAVAASVILHLSLFAIALYVPDKGGKSGPVYYVDLVNWPGGGGKGGGNKAKGKGNQLTAEPQRQRMKDLTAQKEEPQSKLRYPDEKSKKKQDKKKKRKKRSLITIEKKDRKKTRSTTPAATVSRKNVLKTGISAGSGGGSGGGIGGGVGPGYGDGSGIGSGSFPYAYYIAALRSKISSSWYNALISPGMRGRFTAVVYFKIMRSGEIRDLKLTERSGIKALDLSSRRAVENASPFPPLPNDYPDNYLGVYFEFVWEKK